jgi:hypothetical protein
VARFLWVPGNELEKYQKGLAELEGEFVYPLHGNQTFCISHGPCYSEFFERMGKSFFVLAEERGAIVGVLAVVFKVIQASGQAVKAAYLSDLKIREGYRGGVLSSKMYLWAALRGLRMRGCWNTPFYYFIGMKGEQGDVACSAKGLSLLKFFIPLGQLSIYFADPERAKNLGKAGLQEEMPDSAMLDLSPNRAGDSESGSPIVSLAGVKDLIFTDKRFPAKVAHLKNAGLTGAAYVDFLRGAGKAADGAYDYLCFCLDSRREALTEYLRSQDIAPVGSAGVYGFSRVGLIKQAFACRVGTYQI